MFFRGVYLNKFFIIMGNYGVKFKKTVIVGVITGWAMGIIIM